MADIKEMEEIVRDHAKRIVFLEKNGCEPLSKKYLAAVNKYFEQLNILESYKKEHPNED
jgi:hypothetical protein